MATGTAWFAVPTGQWAAIAACLPIESEGLFLRVATLVQQRGELGRLKLPKKQWAMLCRLASDVFARLLQPLIDAGAVATAEDGEQLEVACELVADSERRVEAKRERDRIRKSSRSPRPGPTLFEVPGQGRTDSAGVARIPSDSTPTEQDRTEEDPPLRSGSSDALASLGCLAPGSSPVGSDPEADASDLAWDEPPDDLKPFERWWRPERVHASHQVAQRRFVGRWTTLRRTLAEAFPALDLQAEFSRAYAWEEANPAEAKTPRGRAAFLNAWLARSQDHRRGGAAPREGPDRLARPPWPRAAVPAGCRVLEPGRRPQSPRGPFGVESGRFGGFLLVDGDLVQQLDFVDAEGRARRDVWTGSVDALRKGLRAAAAS